MSEDLQAQVCNLLVERLFLKVSPTELDPKASLSEKYGVDSVRLFDMVTGLEEAFDIVFDDDELKIKNFDSAEVICQRIRDKKQ